MLRNQGMLQVYADSTTAYFSAGDDRPGCGAHRPSAGVGLQMNLTIDQMLEMPVLPPVVRSYAPRWRDARTKLALMAGAKRAA